MYFCRKSLMSLGLNFFTSSQISIPGSKFVGPISSPNFSLCTTSLTNDSRSVCWVSTVFICSFVLFGSWPICVTLSSSSGTSVVYSLPSPISSSLSVCLIVANLSVTQNSSSLSFISFSGGWDLLLNETNSQILSCVLEWIYNSVKECSNILGDLHQPLSSSDKLKFDLSV